MTHVSTAAAKEGSDAGRAIALVLQTTQQECDTLRRPLKEAGLAVKTTTNADEALDFFSRHRPAIVFVPAYLSSGSSYIFCRKLRDEYGETELPIILTTALVSGRLMIEARTKWGVNDVLVLPVSLQKLLQLVGQYVEITRPPTQTPAPKTMKTPSRFTDFRFVSAESTKKTINPAGDLSEVRPERVLRLMALNKRTGVVEFSSMSSAMELHFREGILSFIHSGLIQGHSLADYLLRSGRVAPGVVREAQAAANRTRRVIGEILLEMGAVTVPDLEYLLHHHLVDKGVLIFGWQTGNYAFNRREPGSPTDVTLRLSVADLILKGIRKYTDPDAIAIEYPKFHTHYFALRQDKGFSLADLQLTAVERQAALAMNGRRTVAEIMESTGISFVDISTLVAALSALRMLRSADSSN